MARIRAMLRRSRGVSPLEAQPVSAAVNEPAAMTESAGLRVDTAARRAWVGSAELALTAKEFELLSLLHSEAGNVVSRERIMDEVWDENWFGSTKTLDMTVSRLRQKLATQTDDATVTTVRGVGFRLELGRAGASA
jgi:DNA-binding response OmpR family regulator